MWFSTYIALNKQKTTVQHLISHMDVSQNCGIPKTLISPSFNIIQSSILDDFGVPKITQNPIPKHQLVVKAMAGATLAPR